MNSIKKLFNVVLLLGCSIGIVYSNSSIGDDTSKRGHNRCPEANLSETQKNTIQEMRKDFKTQTKDLSKEEKRATKQEFKQSILDTVLESDEQRSALSECWSRSRKHRKNKHSREKE